jgi:hypothetical protein
MAATDARPIPRKNVAFRVSFPIYDADGDTVTAAATLDSEGSIDGGAFADVTAEATEIGTSGIYTLDLTAAEMNGDTIVVRVQTSTVGAKTTVIVMYPQEAADIRVDVDTWRASAPDALVLGNVPADVQSWVGVVPDALVSGNVPADVQTVAGTVQTAGDIIGDTNDIQARLPAALIGGRMSSDVEAWLNVVPNALLQGRVQSHPGTAVGTADSGTTTTFVDTERTEADTDYWKGAIVLFTNGTLAGQARLVTAFNAATDEITFAPATTVAVGTHTYILLPAARADVHFWLGVLVNSLIAGRVDANAQVVGDKTGYSLTSAEEDAIVNKVWDELTSEGRTVGSYGQLVKDDINATISSRATDAGVWAVGTRRLTSIEAADLVTAAVNKIADHVLRRTYANARVSSDGDAVNFRSLLGAIGKLVNKWSISGATLTVFQEDDVTSTAPGGTQAITATAGADPITALDTT